MRTTLSMLVVMVMASGCWRGDGQPDTVVPAPPAKPQAEANLAMMSMFRDRMCECESRPCLDGVQAAMSEWVEQRMSDPQPYSPPPSEATLARITEVGLSMSECANRLITTTAAR